MTHIKENLSEIEKKIQAACERTGRTREEVTLIAVTKTKPVEDIREVIDYGINDIGENKVQEILMKYPEFQEQLIWHMIGHLQTNKVKMIIDQVDLIHSVDSLKLAAKINDEAKKIDKVQKILIQINIAEEESKFGLEVDDVEELIRDIAKLPNIMIKGLMTIAPFVEDSEENRGIFRQMTQIFVDINKKNIDNVIMNTLSMGMTNDYEVAIEEGSTMVRIGTAIFGQRNYH